MFVTLNMFIRPIFKKKKKISISGGSKNVTIPWTLGHSDKHLFLFWLILSQISNLLRPNVFYFLLCMKRLFRWQPGQQHHFDNDWPKMRNSHHLIITRKMWTLPPTVDDSNHHIFVHSFRPIPTSPPSVPLSPSSFHSSFTIFTVSLSGSVVETCHSGLPKGRTLVLPFTLCQKK